MHTASVQNIVKRTSPGTTEGTQAIKALKHLEKVHQNPFRTAVFTYEWRFCSTAKNDLALFFNQSGFQLIQESNDSITQMKSIESLVSLSAKVDFECRVSKDNNR